MLLNSNSKPVVSIDNLFFSFPYKENVIKNISLNIFPGDRIGVIGPNGAGKTTLFLLINGILKPDSGYITVFDTKVKQGQFIPEVGYVFQNPDDQLFCLSVNEDIAFGPGNMGLTREEIIEKTEYALKVTGITHLKDRPPHYLSTGEKRMVSIACILAMDPKIIIYDEPTSNLDIRSRRRLIEFINKSSEIFLAASHDLEFILEVCNRIILIDNGEIIADNKPADILGNRQLMQDHGLEVPHSLIPHKHY